MKKTIYIILAALIVTRMDAAPLKKGEWKTTAPDDTYTFHEDGSLTLTGNTSGKEFYYCVEEGTKPMVNGSGLSITLQFNTAAFLGDSENGLYVCFKPDNQMGEAVDGKAYFHKLTVQNVGDQLNIYDLNNDLDDYFTLSNSDDLVTVKFNYTIKDNELHYSYTLNGADSPVYVWSYEKVNPSLDWRPSFGVSNSETNSFTVTDVTFISVPEPTTPTLSLLALTGLAVRRRRK